jgi:putative ABC transport system substrate-binding protein
MASLLFAKAIRRGDAMRRRRFLQLFGGIAAGPFAGPLTAEAQPIRRIGFMGNSTAELEANLVGPFRDGLSALGYEPGRNIAIEYRWANGEYDRFPRLVNELLAAKVEVIVTAGTPASQAVKRATSTVPLVMIAVGDPVGTGLVPSLARPGGNITGLSSIAPDLEGKRLELLRDLVPALAHVAVFWNPSNAFHAGSLKQARIAADKLQIRLLPLAVRRTVDLDAAFKAILKDRPEALDILADRIYLHDRQPMMDFTIQNKLPSMSAYRELVVAGGLMSFGPSYEHMHRRAADYVDKILKGAKPGDLPIEQPTKFDLRVNLKTAGAIGLKIPDTFLLRADEVIE